MPEERTQAQGRGAEDGACTVTLRGHPAVLGQLAWVSGPLEGFPPPHLLSRHAGKVGSSQAGLTLCPSMSLPKHWGRGGLWESFLDETLQHEERAPVQGKTQPTCSIGGLTRVRAVCEPTGTQRGH